MNEGLLRLIDQLHIVESWFPARRETSKFICSAEFSETSLKTDWLTDKTFVVDQSSQGHLIVLTITLALSDYSLRWLKSAEQSECQVCSLLTIAHVSAITQMIH